MLYCYIHHFYFLDLKKSLTGNEPQRNGKFYFKIKTVLSTWKNRRERLKKKSPHTVYEEIWKGSGTKKSEERFPFIGGNAQKLFIHPKLNFSLLSKFPLF